MSSWHTAARHLIGREQYIHTLEQLDVGAYGYLVSRTALLHPKGETFDVSMGLRRFFDALAKIAAQPDKDFGELVRQRRRKRGSLVAPAGKVLPFLPAHRDDDQVTLAASTLQLNAYYTRGRRSSLATNWTLHENDWPNDVT